MRALRAEMPAPDPDGPPLFWSLDGGMASLVRTLVTKLEERGVDIRLSVPADRLERAGAGWSVWSGGEAFRADAVVLAAPAPATGALLRPHDDEAAALLQTVEYASVVLVTFRVGAEDIPSPLHGTGFLVPRRSPHKGRDQWAVTACTFLDRKWPHLARDGEALLRASLGRMDDARPEGWTDGEAIDRAWEELRRADGRDRSTQGRRRRALPRRTPAVPRASPASHGRGRGCRGPSRRRRRGRRRVSRGRHSGLHREWPGGSAHPVVIRLPRRGRVAAPSVAAGILLALSLPPFGWWPLGPLGAGLLYWRLGGLGLRTRVWSGWLAGLGCYVIGLAWARAFNWYGAVVLIVVEALFFAAAAALTPPRRGRAPAFVAACTLAEALRMTWPFGGLPLGGVFLGQARGPLVQLARLGGPLLDHGRGLGRRGGRRHAPPRGGGAAGTAPADLPQSAWSSSRAGSWRSRSPAHVAPDGGAPVRALRVALVQGGGQRGLSKEQVTPTTVYEAQVAATDGVTSAHPGPELVLWPEDVVALDRPLAGSPEALLLSRLAQELGTTLVVGVTEPASPTTFRNEIVAWGPHGHIVGVFEKVHRVPFGEYVPDRSFFARLADLSGVPTDAVPGHGTGLMRTPAGPLGLLVSFEVFYAGRSHASVRAGAELLAVPTNTSSYSTSQVPAQEISAAVVQAVETGRDLVQAAPTGYSAVVTNRGVVVNRSTLGQTPGARGHRRPPSRHDPVRPLGRPPGPDPLGRGARRRLGPSAASVVVPGVDVHARDPRCHVHGVVRRVVLEREPEVEPLRPQVLVRPPP